MIDVEVERDTIRVTDSEKNELSIRTDEWRPREPDHAFDRRVEERVAGTTRGLAFPRTGALVESSGRDQWRTFTSTPGPVTVEDGTHVVQIESAIVTYVRFRGTATLDWGEDGDDIRISFPGPTRVTLGFRSRDGRPMGTMTVPRTPDGVATALTHMAAAHEATSPDRSYPSQRRYPPAVELGDEPDVPRALREEREGTGVTLRAPSELGALFVVAPLAYYLGATVEIDEVDRPRLDLGEGWSRGLGADRGLQREVAALLRRVFLLDCLVRTVGPYGTDLAEAEQLGKLDLDPAAAYDLPMAARARRYLSVPFDRIEGALPEWHLSTAVEPRIEHLGVVPHLLDRLSLITRPAASGIGRADLVDRSLSAFYRAGARSEAGGRDAGALVSDHDLARVSGWLAEGTPIDAFRALPEAFENRFDYLGDDGPIDVTVVLNDDGMAEEQSAAARIYRERGDRLSIDVRVERGLRRAGLRRVFEAGTDFVHYIGHCDDAGLRCPDGHVAAANLAESNVRTFFLNGCGSCREGLDLIRKGSVAGAVTLDAVLDEQATRVGTAFARLVINGFSIGYALQLARPRSIMNKNYVAVGDGTYSVSQHEDVYPVVAEVESIGQDRFRLSIQSFLTRTSGGMHQPFISSEEIYNLCGNSKIFKVSREELISYLENVNTPCFYEGAYYWSQDLYAALRKGSNGV